MITDVIMGPLLFDLLRQRCLRLEGRGSGTTSSKQPLNLGSLIMEKLPDFHGPHTRPRRFDAELVEWCEPIPRFQRVRVRRHTCECKPRIYELCTAGGLAWVRRTDRLKSVVKVGESPPCSFREAEELWEKLLAGRAT